MTYMQHQADTEDWSSILDVCQTCLYGAAYGGDGLSSDDQATLDGLEYWNGWRLVPSCPEECDPGFTWARCDICNQGGRESHTVWADPFSPEAWQDIAALTYMYGMGDGSRAIQGAETYRTRSLKRLRLAA